MPFIDSSAPQSASLGFLRPFNVQEYDAAVFHHEGLPAANLEIGRVVFIPPAIDPVSTKNMELRQRSAFAPLARWDIDLRRPLLVQSPRFDPWKALLASSSLSHRQREAPEIQLAMIGAMAGDDPQGWEVLDKINAEAANDPDFTY